MGTDELIRKTLELAQAQLSSYKTLDSGGVIMSKSEMKRIATINPIAAANRIDELERQLRAENARAKNAEEHAAALQARITELESKLSKGE